ncbi:MAG: TolC family protein [Arcobacteraceae bacterium]
MLKKITLLVYLFISSGFAVSLDEMVERVLVNNADLKSLEHSIEVSNSQIDLSSNWKNPTLSLGANDIQFDDPSKRDIEAMQAQYIGFSQVIPMGEKLELQKEISIKEKQIALYMLEDKKLQLKSLVYEYGYSVVILEKKYELLNKYLQNIKSLEELSSSLYENGKINQTDIIDLKISYSQTQLKQQKLKNLINNLYLKLEELSFTKIDSIDLSLDIKPLKFTTTFDTHPKLLVLQEKSLQYNDISRLELEKRTSDIKLNVTYFNRDSKYEDYANISVNIPLAIYGTEKTSAMKAKQQASQMNSNLVNLNNTFRSSILILQNDLDNALLSYKIIKETILPLKEKVQKNIESYNKFSLTSPQSTIQNLNDVISYEQMLLDEMQHYFTSYSKSLYFTQGKMK